MHSQKIDKDDTEDRPGVGKLFRNLAVQNPKDERINPCANEYRYCDECMGTFGDRKKCDVLFRNYKNCVEFWTAVVHDRHNRKIKPLVPLLPDREKIKKEYLDNLTNSKS